MFCYVQVTTNLSNKVLFIPLQHIEVKEIYGVVKTVTVSHDRLTVHVYRYLKKASNDMPN